MTKTRFELKLIASAFLAFLMGVAFALPLLFSMFGTTKGATGPKTQFNFDLPYVYITCGNRTLDNKEVQIVDYTIVLNWTHLYDAETVQCDARIEVYLIEICSDNGFIGKMAESVGTNYTFCQIPSAPYPYVATPHFLSPYFLDDWFGGPPPSGYYEWDWPTGKSKVFSFVGGRTDWVQAFAGSETIFMRIRREGWVTFNDDSWLATPASGEEVTTLQLKKFGNGFLYNTIVPEDELLQMDPLHPSFDPETVTPIPTATPTDDIPPAYTYATVSIVVIILIELGYALMRKRKKKQIPAGIFGLDEN